MSRSYDEERARYTKCFPATADGVGVNYSAARKEELRTTPLVSLDVKHRVEDKQGETLFPQYALLGRHVGNLDHVSTAEPILMNTNAPSSTFICGSQGSGKSYTLSCMLENCLRKDNVLGKLVKPLTGVVFHYDRNGAGAVAEAASLCSTGVKVRVLVSRSWYHQLAASYSAVPGATEKNMEVLPLLFQDHHLEADRILKLMALSGSDNAMPLYMDVLLRILRDTAVNGKQLTLADLDRQLDAQNFTPSQRVMLEMRMGLLRSFCASSAKQALADAQARVPGKANKDRLARTQPPIPEQDLFALQPGTLTIIDLTDPFVDASTACVLFDMCLGLITSGKHLEGSGGLVIALDEAHKFLNKTPAADEFTEQILTTIRMQRHCAARILVATQEPTISERLLDLCSVSIVHRFSSPAWFTAIKGHLGGASALTTSPGEQQAMFERIMGLPVGESLVFSPSSYVSIRDGEPGKLGAGVMRMKTRMRKGGDAGRSVLSIRSKKDGSEDDSKSSSE
ncbi:hypothetical protein LTR91_006753 [Friedmanniomyces endolithicus]|uniref:AAA+ ATPase domain-containing protein n=1 Tax=Friedmanniomyces endolithicus TaxID=329885 RepID=A0AAN6KQN9_9PEZI|nr:hypothetical protein LTR94_011950 [Friedmanniomyces endolithicus]KAK0783920.1 hypothetical protein LTR59_011631 [Friedmanniomyces endolithicus]KAK0790252.1 hypothetical protein LTR38_010640 [Friedmanniomyces endolithicus]KAK0821215.1 hypothetical protein LTR75_001016 [Friedmanniomyces endolithicus]KAK0823817.1 hypothetical protein LTR03_017868 [Friedmanniomyces endolithicus]